MSFMVVVGTCKRKTLTETAYISKKFCIAYWSFQENLKKYNYTLRYKDGKLREGGEPGNG